MTALRVLQLDTSSYRRNRLHAPDMPWQETNCYMDVLIEVIHAVGAEVEPCLAFTLASDFELDQWTFFKPPLADLDLLYDLDIEELTLWRPLVEHSETQITAGRLPLVEVDSFYLPDTAGTDYRCNHVKTTIAINEIDRVARRISYFHNTGFHQLCDEDFDGLFRLSGGTAADTLPPYCEIIKLRTASVPKPEIGVVLDLVQRHAGRRPGRNPFLAYSEVFEQHLDWIREGGLPTYHAYVFAGLRQCGAAFDLASRLMEWLSDRTSGDWSVPAREFAEISAVSKSLLMKLARVANGRRSVDCAPQLQQMADAWAAGFEALDALLDRD